MTSAQRAQLLQAISSTKLFVGKNSFLRRLSLFQVSRVYEIFRPGAENEALDMLGTWMQWSYPLRPLFSNENEVASPLGTFDSDVPQDNHSFFALNRRRAFNLADQLTFEHPGAINTIEEKYLEKTDASSSLGAAYVLAYSYAFRGKLQDWIDKLDKRLSKEFVRPEAHVDWLLARASGRIEGGTGSAICDAT